MFSTLIRMDIVVWTREEGGNNIGDSEHGNTIAHNYIVSKSSLMITN